MAEPESLPPEASGSPPGPAGRRVFDRGSGRWLRKERERISRDALTSDLEVEVIGRRVTGVADRSDHRAGLHFVARLDEVRAVVRVDRAESVRVSDLDR